MRRHPNDRPGTGPQIVSGGLVILLFFGMFLGWAAVVPLDSAALASGVAMVEGERKTVQHLEGGIVQEIRVEEGQKVRRGEILVVLQGVDSLVDLDALSARRIHATAEAARRKAERDVVPLEFPTWVTEGDMAPKAASAVAEETALFHARKDNHVESIAILEHRIDQMVVDVQGAEEQLGAERRQIEMLQARIRNLEPKVKAGVITSLHLYDLRQEEAKLEADLAETRARLEGSHQKRAEFEAQIRHLISERRLEASEALAKLTREIAEIETRMRSAEDVLARRNIRAPIDGVVLNLATHTVGGVIAPGAVVLELVPSDADLVIDARLRPQDRDAVKVGDYAQVRIDTLGLRDAPPLPGRVASVSADRMIAEQGQEDFFRARIEFELPSTTPDPGIVVFPGMQASVIIQTGERTALSYLTEPLTKSFWRAMREQ